jgi:hypothetical protein
MSNPAGQNVMRHKTIQITPEELWFIYGKDTKFIWGGQEYTLGDINYTPSECVPHRRIQYVTLKYRACNWWDTDFEMHDHTCSLFFDKCHIQVEITYNPHLKIKEIRKEKETCKQTNQ